MFTPSEIGINPSACISSGKGGAGGGGGGGGGGGVGQTINRLSQTIINLFTQLANGNGTVLRFRLTSLLDPGGYATAQIVRFEDGGFVRVRDGTVYDEEPGGFWTGDIDQEGWCTARDGEEDQYSILFMPQEQAEQQTDTIPVTNNSSEDIPPYSVLRPRLPTTIDGEPGYFVVKPSSLVETFWLVNGPDWIPVGENGQATLLDKAGWVAFDSLAGDPETTPNNLSNNVSATTQIQTLWGPTNNSWLLAPTTGRGFMTLGNKKTVSDGTGGTVDVCRAIQLFDIRAYISGYVQFVNPYAVSDWLQIRQRGTTGLAGFLNSNNTTVTNSITVDISGVYEFHIDAVISLSVAPAAYDTGRIKFRLYIVAAGGTLGTATGTDAYAYTDHHLFLDKDSNAISTIATMSIHTHVNLAKGEGVAVKIESDDIGTAHGIWVGQNSSVDGNGTSVTLKLIAPMHIHNNG